MMFKRFLSLTLAAVCAAALVSCGQREAPPVSSSEGPAVSVLAPVEPEPVLPYRNPLTGEGCAADIGQNRPIAVMLNNLQKATPQLGVASADLIYEMPAEGGITRMMALFQTVEGVGSIGSVRSARDYYVSLACGHDAIFLHAGGSPQAYDKLHALGMTALDCVNGPYEGTLYWRDKARWKRIGKEHSVLTSGDTIEKLLPTYKRVPLSHQEDFTEGLVFLDPGQTAQGQPAREVSVCFSPYKTGVFTYDPPTGRYTIQQYGAPYIDGSTNELVSVKNVLVLYTEVTAVQGDDQGRQAVRTTGTGSGQLFCDGTVQDITWHKATDRSPMTFTDAVGQPLRLGVGPSYLNIVDRSAEVLVR